MEEKNTVSSLFETLIKIDLEQRLNKKKSDDLKRAAEQKRILKSFKSYQSLLVFLADASPKERQLILKNWQTDKAKEQTGRKKENKYDRTYFMWFVRIQAKYEYEQGKELSDKQVLELYYKNQHPEKPISEWRKEFKTIQNNLAKIRKELNSSQ